MKIFLNSKRYCEPWRINQYTKLIPVTFEVYNADGTPFSFATTDVVKLEMRIGTVAIIVSTGFEISGNVATLSLPRAISLNSGKGYFNFVVENSDGTKRQSSSKINVYIESNAIDESTVPDTLQISAREELNSMITNAENIYSSNNLANYLLKTDASSTYVAKETGKGLSVNDYTDAEKAEVAKVKNKLDTSALLNKIYPVGSIYISTKNVSPATILGGTWTRFSKGQVLVGVDEDDTDFAAGKTGGEKTHTLSTNEIPSHNHSEIQFINGSRVTIDANGGGSVEGYKLPYTVVSNIGSETKLQTSDTGGDQAHNNLQPYVAVYMWERIA